MTRWRQFVPAVVPALVGLCLLVVSSPERAALMLAVGLVVFTAVAAGVDVSGRIAKLADALARALTMGLGWLAEIFLVLPVWLLNVVFRRGTSKTRSGWERVPDGLARPERTFGADPRLTQGGGLLRTVTTTVGALVIVGMLDLGLGIAWNHLSGSGPTGASGAIRLDPKTAFDLDSTPDTVSSHPPDPRENGPAMAEYPWSHDYFQEFQSVGSIYWPFTLYRPKPFKGEYINIDGWERSSHQPVSINGTTPVVAFFGGSAMWGEGQRDGFTIASYVSRIAEADGLPVRVRNFGQRGWVIWQEMTLYEQLLAAGADFDMSVFYDGPNDMTVQTGPVVGVPTHYDVTEYAERLGGGGGNAEASRTVSDWVASRSLIFRAFRRVFPAENPKQSTRVDGLGVNPNGFERRGVDVYQRGRDLARGLSRTYGVDGTYFWQPQREDLPEYRWAGDNVGSPTISLDHVLDGHADVYLDAVHTNEVGARLIAEAMWKTLRPKVQAFYAAEGQLAEPPR